MVAASIQLCLFAIEYVMISITYGPFNFWQKSSYLLEERGVYFSTNSLINFWSYCLASAIGIGVFSLLVLAVNLYVKKMAILICSGLLLGIFFIILPAQLNMILGLKDSLVMSASFLLSLISPTTIAFGARVSNMPQSLIYICSLVFYLTVTIVLFAIKMYQMKDKRQITQL